MKPDFLPDLSMKPDFFITAWYQKSRLQVMEKDGSMQYWLHSCATELHMVDAFNKYTSCVDWTYGLSLSTSGCGEDI